jgi:hypothetical protein
LLRYLRPLAPFVSIVISGPWSFPSPASPSRSPEYFRMCETLTASSKSCGSRMLEGSKIMIAPRRLHSLARMMAPRETRSKKKTVGCGRSSASSFDLSARTDL